MPREANVVAALANDPINMIDPVGEVAGAVLSCLCELAITDVVTPDPTDIVFFGKCCAYALAIPAAWAIARYCENPPCEFWYSDDNLVSGQKWCYYQCPFPFRVKVLTVPLNAACPTNVHARD